MLKKIIIIGIAIIVIFGVIAAVRITNTGYIPKNADLNTKAKLIFQHNGCLDCHSSSAALPFYGNFPIIGKTVKQDILEGYRDFDIDPVIMAIDSGRMVSETALAKLEHAILTGSMPPWKYKIIHWGTGLNEIESADLLEWVRNLRRKYFSTGLAVAEFENEILQPLPDSIEVDNAKALLGFKLFHDPRLSLDNSISCSTCHLLDQGGVDGEVFSDGVGGTIGVVNAPTVFNSFFNKVQFWDGRAADLGEQAGGPPLNPIEMASASWEEIIQKLEKDKGFTEEFKAVYPQGYSEKTITDAIAEFEKTLITPNSRFDKYLKGDKNALSEDEVKGYILFKANECATCHVGKNIGGQSFELMGVKHDYFIARGGMTTADSGRFNISKDKYDLHRFKTPTLRNVALTAPYYHDGSVATLEDAVRMMAKYQTGKELNEEQVNKIVAFLMTLTGEYKGENLTNKKQQ